LWARPHITNPDGSRSTVHSTSFGNDAGEEVLVPGMNSERLLSDKEALDQYRKTGQNLGTFSDPESATEYAKALHDRYEQGYYDLPFATSNKSADPNLMHRAITALMKTGWNF